MQPRTLTEAPFQIVRPQSFYTIEGVKFPNGEYGAVQVTEKLLDDDKSRSQREWQDYRTETGWGPGSGPLITATLTALREHEGRPGVKELRNLFRDDFRKNWMMTATGITYRTWASDMVTHDSGTPEQRTLEARLIGPSCYVNDGMSKEIQALLGSVDVSNVRDVYRWVTGKEGYLWRLNKQPKRNEEQALVLGGIDFVDFYIYADGSISNYAHARGMRIAPQNSTGSKS